MQRHPKPRAVFFAAVKYLAIVPLLSLPATITFSGELNSGRAEASRFAQGLYDSAKSVAQGSPTRAALKATESAIDYWLPGLGDDGPEWLSRFEFDWNVGEDDKPEFSLLTVQPLYQSRDSRDTIFTQLRIARDYSFGKYRTTTNIGLGYRRLVANNNVLLGANVFFDREWRFNHSRLGFGGEARISGFDLFVNYYDALTGKHNTSTTTFEEALNGFDAELTAQVPYLPWARVRGKYFTWDTKALGDNIDGYTASVELDLHQNIQLEAGYTDDDFNDGVWFLTMRFIPGNRHRPVLASSRAIDSQAFQWRDMRDYTLDKVRRQNTIVVERTSGGSVTISRGS